MKITGRRVAKNTVFNLLGEGLPSIVAVVSLPFLIHWLGEERFGLFMLIWAIRGYLQFLSLRLGFALMKFAAEAIHRKEESRLSCLTWTTVILLAILGSIGGVTLGMFALFGFTQVFQIPTQLWREARVTLLLAALSVPITITTTGFRALLAAGQRFDLINIVNGTSGCLRYLVSLLLARMGFHLLPIVLTLLLLDALRLIVYSMLCFRVYPPIRSFTLDFQSAKPLLWFGGWLSVSQVVGMAITYLDRFIIGLLLPISYVGYYAIPVEIINRLQILSSSLNRAIFPAFSALGNTERSLQLYARAMKFMFLIATPIALILALFSKDLLTLYIGEETALKSAPVLQVLAFIFLLISLRSITVNFIIAFGYPNSIAKIRIMELLLYAGLVFWFTFKMGICGTALARLLQIGVGAIFIFFVLQWLAPRNISILASNGIGRALILSCILCLSIVSLHLKMRSTILEMLIILVIMMIYVIIIWQVVLNSSERKAIKSFLGKAYHEGGILR